MGKYNGVVETIEEQKINLEMEPKPEPYWRPKTRGDCANVPRPCPYKGCKYNLGLEVDALGRLIQRETKKESCTLDAAEKGQHDLQEIADILGCTKEWVRQLEDKGLKKIKKKLHLLGIDRDFRDDPVAWRVMARAKR